eukprot:Gb_20740 [translate_table: standard]
MSSTTKSLGSAELFQNKKYDVFLSFQGKDIRKTFVNHLHNALTASGIHAFLDNENLERGEDIQTSLYDAIDKSVLFIPVFSKNYGDSRWCLDELLRRRSKGKIMPLFYDVEPEDVRYQKGAFGEAFNRQHITHRPADENEIVEWRTTLKYVSSLSGWSMSEAGGYEGNLIRIIVNKVLETLNRVPLEVADYPVGLQPRIGKLLELVMKGGEDGVRSVGIHGMGGLGKTTLAKAVYNNIYLDFEAACFVSDVGGRAESANGLRELQRQVLRDLLKIDTSVDLESGKSLIKNRLRGTNVLLVLDNIQREDQLSALAGSRDWFGPGSRIIVTSRDQHLLNRVVAACERLPLALENLGKYLTDKEDEQEWEDVLSKVGRGISDQGVLQTLRISYNGLRDKEEQQIFLDTACFFQGMDKDIAISIWNACKWGGSIAVKDLVHKSLIKISDDNRLVMHDLIQKMGTEIVEEESKEPGERSRLWSKEYVRKVLKKCRARFYYISTYFCFAGTDKVRGLSYQSDKQPTAWKTESFAPMTELQFLSLHNVLLEGEFGKILSKLRWLKWTNSPLQCLPTDLNNKRLAVLELTGNTIKQVWDEPVHLKMPRDLKYLIRRDCESLERTPDFSNHKNIEKLWLSGCTGLTEIHCSIGNLKELVHLDLANCTNLRALPETIHKLCKVKIFILSGCKNLMMLPDKLGDLKALKELLLDNTAIAKLPSSFGSLCSLEKLNVSTCRSLQEIPASIDQLQRLRFLDMGHCGVSTLPEEFGLLVGLQELILEYCRELQRLPNTSFKFFSPAFLKELEAGYCNLALEGALPTDFEELSSLNVLGMEYSNFRWLPASFRGLSQLTNLRLHHCMELCELPTLPSCLVEMDIGDCVKLRTIGDLSNLKWLKNMVLCNCSQLPQLPGLEGLMSLVDLNISGCQSIASTSLDRGLEGLTSLQRLHLSGSSVSVCNLNKWIREVPSLQELNIYGSSVPLWFRHQMHGQLDGKEHARDLCLDVPIRVKPNVKIEAVIFCFVSHDQGWSDYEWDHGRYNSNTWMEATIIRGEEEVHNTRILRNRHADRRDQLHLSVYREGHPFVMNLQNGDRIRVWARSIYAAWRIWVKEGGMHILYREGEEKHEQDSLCTNIILYNHPSYTIHSNSAHKYAISL